MRTSEALRALAKKLVKVKAIPLPEQQGPPSDLKAPRPPKPDSKPKLD